MRFERFDPLTDETRLAACRQIAADARPVDDPNGLDTSRTVFRKLWGYGFTGGDPREAWLAAGESGPVGCYLLELPGRANRDLGSCVLTVTPAARRRGIGTALLSHCAGRARAAGRTRLLGRARAGTAGEKFAQRAGARTGLIDVRRILRVDDGLPARLAGLRATAAGRAAGYQVLRWSGPVPGELAGQVAHLHTVMNDAPREASVADEQWDADRVRASEAAVNAPGFRLYSVAARHEASGELAGLTQVLVDPDQPGLAAQLLTAVARAHRGRRLGLLIKVAMHEWLAEAEPALRRVDTFNAETNPYMIAINEALGFTASDRFANWELSLG